MNSLRFSLLLLVGATVLSAEPGPRPPGGPSAQILLSPAGAEALNAEVRAADDERVAATIAADRSRLDAIMSEALHYAHSNGSIDTKASLVESLASRRVVYESIEYVSRDFLIAAEDIVLMTGRARIRAGAPGQMNNLELGFLAVWRREAGRWRFLAWQSARLPSPPR